MNKTTIRKTGIIGTIIATACCFGAAGFFLSLFGFASALLWVNTYGDYVFNPALGFFGTFLIYSVCSLKNKPIKYGVIGIVSALMLYVSVWGISLIFATLIGIILGLLLIKFFGGRNKK